MFGWDWGPQMPDGGIWRSVFLDIYKYGYIDNIWFKTIELNKDCAKVSIDVRNKIITSNKDLSLNLKFKFQDEVLIDEISIFDNTNHFEFEVKDPHIWYPFGYGDQPLYDIVVSILYKGKTIYEKCDTVGIRKVEIRQELDQYGKSFTFVFNDIPIFLKGSDYIIEDNIFPRRDNSKTKFLLDSAIFGNQNTLRVWGGGIFPDDYFYYECDRLGIILWQDLMFACTYYNMENEDFKEEIRLEIIDNMERIRNHPSIGLVCGNNENETAANDWNVPNLEYTKKWYLYQYEEFIPNILKEVIPNIFYWPSSPSSGGGFDKPNDDSRGDMHYWGVWHNNEPIEYYRHYFPRIMSEFGMQSFPLEKTVNSFTIKEDRNIFSYVMERHQKNTSANQKIMNYIGSMFKFPKNFNMLLYISEVIQAEGVRYCVEHLRRNYGRCMGSIYWQLNDCWPVASWSSIDYYGRYKALHYYSARFYDKVLVSIEEEYNDKCYANVYITNEHNHDIKGKLTIKLMYFNGDVIDEKELDVSVSKYSKKETIRLVYDLDKETRKRTFLLVYFKNKTDNDVYINDVSFCKDKYLELDKPNIKFELYQDSDYEYSIVLETDTYAKYVYLENKKYDIIFSDNFFNLPTGGVMQVLFKSYKKIKKEDFRIISLYDEYN